jgi:hypothetical protein
MLYTWSNCRYAGPMIAGHEHRELPEALADRSPPPEDVFCLPLVDTWRDRIWRTLDDIVTPEVKAEFLANPPEYVVSDDLSWLDDIVFDATGRVVDMKELVADRFAREYRAFRAGHATRTDDVGQFYRDGLRYLRPHEIEERARKLFLTGQYPHASEAKLQAAIENIDARKPSGGRPGRLYFAADERSLITRMGGSGHYLVYGSEYLYCLGIRTIGEWETRQALKSIGRPTMFVCDIPMSMMRPHTLGEFGGMIIEHLFCELGGLECHALGPGSGSALSMAEDLPGDCIVGHYHPERVHAPY